MESVLNRHLWLLTGRFNDFVTPALNTGRRYGDALPSEEVLEARRLLFLGDTSTDYYVIGAMAALVSFRPNAGPDDSPLFLPRNLHIRPPEISGGAFRPSGPQHPSLLHRPSALPAARRWYVTKNGTDTVHVSTDTGYSKTLHYRMASGVVYIDWPEEIGFKTAFAPTGGLWEVGSSVTITSEPSGYPYTSVALAIKQSHSLVRLMSTEGTLSEFHAAQSSIQKVGALVSAVVQWGAKANP